MRLHEWDRTTPEVFMRACYQTMRPKTSFQVRVACVTNDVDELEHLLADVLTLMLKDKCCSLTFLWPVSSHRVCGRAIVHPSHQFFHHHHV